MMLIEPKYNIKDFVYLTTDTEQKKRIVVGILIQETRILYELASGDISSYHNDFEISKEKDVLITSDN
jgi:hypothetical protein